MSIEDDVRKMIETLRDEVAIGPVVMHIPDDTIVGFGGNPNDWPELKGHPGIRVVRWSPKSTKVQCPACFEPGWFSELAPTFPGAHWRCTRCGIPSPWESWKEIP